MFFPPIFIWSFIHTGEVGGGPCPHTTIINSYLTRTICVQTGEIPDPSAAGGGGDPGEAEGGICARGLTKISPFSPAPFRRTLKSEPTEVAWLSGLSPLFARPPPPPHFTSSRLHPLSLLPRPSGQQTPPWMVSKRFCAGVLRHYGARARFLPKLGGGAGFWRCLG